MSYHLKQPMPLGWQRHCETVEMEFNRTADAQAVVLVMHYVCVRFEHIKFNFIGYIHMVSRLNACNPWMSLHSSYV